MPQRKANPQTQYQFPNLMNDRLKPKNTDPMVGQNTQGSQPGYQDNKGFFQWGTGQYGYVNPQGKIDWGVTPSAGKNRFIAAQPVMKWAKSQGMKPRDEFGMPTQQKGGAFLHGDPQYRRTVAEMTGERGMFQQQYKNRLDQMRADFQRNIDELKRAFGYRTDQEQARLASSGFGRGGAVNAAARQRSLDVASQREALEQQLGRPAQERLQAERSMFDTTYRARLQAEQELAKERWDAEQEYLKAIGKTPKVIAEPQKGFYKKGSTWFYRNADGIEISVPAPPEHIQKKLRRRG